VECHLFTRCAASSVRMQNVRVVPYHLSPRHFHGPWHSLSAINNRILGPFLRDCGGKGKGQSRITNFAPLTNNGYFISCANLTSLPRLSSMPVVASSSHFPAKGKRPVRGQGTASIPSPFPVLARAPASGADYTRGRMDGLGDEAHTECCAYTTDGVQQIVNGPSLANSRRR
jgi:hypothetical protein